MDKSILDTIKQMLGLEVDYDAFDTDVIVIVNSVMLNLNQLGVLSNEDFVVTDSTQLWSDIIADDKTLLAVQTYVYLKTRLMFDPPSNSFVVEAMNKQISELEWRLNIQAERDKNQNEEV